jgi:hypothetical protein
MGATGLLLLSVLLCLIAGSAIDTGTICIVRAVNEAIAGKPALVLGSRQEWCVGVRNQ